MASVRGRSATHEAGHAVAVFILGARIDRITVQPNERGCGIVEWGRDAGCNRCDPIAQAVVALAGAAAESSHYGNGDDAEPRTSAVDRAVLDAALAEMAHSWIERDALLLWLRVRTRELVATPWFAYLMAALLPPLIEHGELTGEDAMSVLQAATDAYERSDGAAPAVGGGSVFEVESPVSPASPPRAQDLHEASGQAVAL